MHNKLYKYIKASLKTVCIPGLGQHYIKIPSHDFVCTHIHVHT